MTYNCEISIRPLTMDDAVDFNRVVGIVARERKYLRFLDVPPMEMTIQFLQDSLAAGNPHFAAVADSKLVGWCDICRRTFEIEAHIGTLGMGILPAFRDKGIGKVLIDAALNAAKHLDFRRIELTVFSDNHRAMALYASRGFVREGLMRAGARFGDKYRDVVMMARLDPELFNRAGQR